MPLTDAALDVIRDLPRDAGNPHLFPSPVKEGAPRADIFKPWNRIREAAGCEDLRIHDLRHTVATMLADDGNAAQVIKSALGHQSLQTTMKYIHAADQGSRHALEAIGEGSVIHCDSVHLLKTLRIVANTARRPA